MAAVANRSQGGFRLALVADATAQATSADVRHALSSLPALLKPGSNPFTHHHDATAWCPAHRTEASFTLYGLEDGFSEVQRRDEKRRSVRRVMSSSCSQPSPTKE